MLKLIDNGRKAGIAAPEQEDTRILIGYPLWWQEAPHIVDNFVENHDFTGKTVMPQMGFGVYQIPEDQTAQAVVDAIASGYRKIDTAQSYFNEA